MGGQQDILFRPFIQVRLTRRSVDLFGRPQILANLYSWNGGKGEGNGKIAVVDSSDCRVRQASALIIITWISRTTYDDNVEFPVLRKSNIRPSLFARNDVPQSKEADRH